MKTQAWGWLAAAVMAAGLNANYHNGGIQWAHQMVNEVTYKAGTVIALASGRVDQLQSEAPMLTARREKSPCPFASVLARVEMKLDRSEMSFDNVEVMSAREQAQLAHLAANRARFEAKLARIRIPAVAFNPVVPSPHVSVCPRVRVSVPRIPAIQTPMVHIEMPGTGPI
ncbi:MAG TPA: hypothetical protein VKQ11_00830 [Candidatus Sulfotelmatobacter sp.]|nr:hypothetical protein [Candidatus Sulfotelmatobacter sp.]